MCLTKSHRYIAITKQCVTICTNLNFFKTFNWQTSLRMNCATILTGNAIIVPIPMHPEKKIQRTFAHVDELLKSAGIPYTASTRKDQILRQWEKKQKHNVLR